MRWFEPCWCTTRTKGLRDGPVLTPENEDRRRTSCEDKTLTTERIAHVNWIKRLLFSQGVSGYEPLHRNRRCRLKELQPDGRPSPTRLKQQISRELEGLELLLEQMRAAEAERDAMLALSNDEEVPTPAKTLMDLKGIGAEFATVLWSEAFFGHFDNRRQVAAYGGLVSTPYQNGTIDREQGGVARSGNPRLRTTMLQLAWLWLRQQPDSALSRWFHERANRNAGHFRKTMITALARKLLVALRKYANAGVVVEAPRSRAHDVTLKPISQSTGI